MDKQNKMVIHLEKYKKNDIQRIARHNLRLNQYYQNENIDLTKSNNNYYFIKPHDDDLKKAILNSVEQKVHGRVTKQSVYMAECIISAGKDFFSDLSEVEEKRFYKLSLEYLAKRFGRDNIHLAVVHRDEIGGNSHMHIDIAMITKDGRLCARDLLSRANLIDIQSELPTFLAENGFDIVRGEKGSKATHMKMSDFKREADKQKKALAKEYNDLVDKYNKLVNEVEQIEKNIIIER